MKYTRLTLAVAMACALSHVNPIRAQETTTAPPPATTGSATGTIADAAKKFLATLDDTQRGKVMFDFNDGAQRQRWSNFPSGIFQRAGLKMGDLTQPQRDAVMAVLAAALSPQGYEKVLQIVDADEVLKKTDTGGGPGGPGGPGGGGRFGGPGGGPRNGPDNGPGGGPGGPDNGGPNGGPDNGGGPRGGPRGGRGGGFGGPGGPGGRGGRGGPGGPGGGLLFGRDLYYIAFLGQPSATEPWMIQFGGHHLGLNITLVGEHGTLAPSHTGAQPAIYELEGKTVRPFGRETDKALALVNSLDEAQRKQAILGFQMRDLVLGPGRDGQTIQPEGIKGAALNDKQREMLLDLASEWTGVQNEAMAKAKMEEMKANLAETWFAWSGPTEKDAAAYFRIQGPTVIIEFAPQRGNEPAKHIHTIYRDPTNPYGAKWQQKP